MHSLLFLTIFLLIWVVPTALLDAAMHCTPLGCTAPWEGMCSPPSACPLPEFRQVVVFCFLGPAKRVPPRWALCPCWLTAPVFVSVPGFPQKFPTPPALEFSPLTGGTGSFQHPIRLGAGRAPSQAPLPAHSQRGTIEVVSDAWLFAARIGSPRLCSGEKQHF